MACPRQMCNKLMCIAISIYVVTSQGTNDAFGTSRSTRACYGSAGLPCTQNSLQCQNDEHVLISDIVCKNGTMCRGVSNCDPFIKNTKKSCCNKEDVILEHAPIDDYILRAYKRCSGRDKCTVYVPNIDLKPGRVTSTNISYHCINKGNIINYCEEANYSNTTVHIMYNGQIDNNVNRDCYCSIHADSVIDLYYVDIRLQKQNFTSSQCTNTILKWGYDQTEQMEECIHSDDNSTLRKLTVTETKDMWVQLIIQDENPTMVWIAAKASGNVNVRCGQQNVNTQAVSDDDTNIGAIVGPVIAIIIIAVLVGIGLIFLRRRRAKQQSSQSTTTRAYEGLTGSSENGSENKACAYDIISDYQISKPIVLPTGCKVTNGEPVVLFASFGDSYKQADETAISDVVNDMYSDINPKDMRSDDPRRNDNSESEYNHLHGVNACETDAQSDNVYSHLKTSLRNTSPSNDGYDHFGCNKPNSLNENNVSSLSSNDYDHLSSANTSNATDCNKPITAHILQATTKDVTVKTSGSSNTPEGLCTATTSQQIEPSCEYAKVKRGKPVAASGYELAGILNDVEV